MTGSPITLPKYGTLYLVRHGQTRLNAAGLLRGHLDPPLDDIGAQQAQALGAIFADTNVNIVVTSPLLRAVQTASSISCSTSAPLVRDGAFIDRDYDMWAGRAREDVEAKYGSLDSAPEIETRGSMTSRALFKARELAAAYESVVIVAHDAVNRALLARLASNGGDDPEQIPQRTGCWNRLEHVGAQWSATVIDALPGDGNVP